MGRRVIIAVVWCGQGSALCYCVASEALCWEHCVGSFVLGALCWERCVGSVVLGALCCAVEVFLPISQTLPLKKGPSVR